MTRLKTGDIDTISSNLEEYDRELLKKTGQTLLGIACHSCGMNQDRVLDLMKNVTINVVPVTAGEGIITSFSETVCAILNHMNFNASVTEETDTAGVARAFENKADAIMMADDNRFVGLNLKTRSLVDNSEATGRVFAAALDLMVKGLKGSDVLIMGCGPVGTGAARALMELGARLALYDIRPQAAQSLKERLSQYPGGNEVVLEQDLTSALSRHRHVIEATPVAGTIQENAIFENTFITAPGVPLGITPPGAEKIQDRLVHDKLELGVASMAVSLLKEPTQEQTNVSLL